jgi:hypothetical protein
MSARQEKITLPIKMHESGTFMRFTQAGADLFA